VRTPFSVLIGAIACLYVVGCGCNAPTLRPMSPPNRVVGQTYADSCLRTPLGKIDFDGMFWTLSTPNDPSNPARDIGACVSARLGPTPHPANEDASFTLQDAQHLRWSNGAVTYLLVPAGQTEIEHCG
jgi:hypothetical protein